MIRKLLVAIAASVMLAGCGAMSAVGDRVSDTFGLTPEAQIVNGANAHKAATVVAMTLLKNDKITVAQAKGFRGLLGAASTTLDDVFQTLVACRKATGTTEKANPDPCRPGVADLIRLALDGIANVRRTLDAKQ